MKRIIIFLALLPFAACKKYLDEPLPSGTINESNAFVSDDAVSSVVTATLANLIDNGMFGGSASGNLAYTTALYTDETRYLNVNTTNMYYYYMDALTPAMVNDWTSSYSQLYAVNAALEGIQSTTANLYHKNQWLGECYFVRGVLLFYLTNLYGNVPLVTTSSYATNNVMGRTPQALVYHQITADLLQAQSLLQTTYADGYGNTTTHRVRPNRYAAAALLSKVYLYEGVWDSAEAEADTVLASSSYALAPVASAFNLNGSETIFAMNSYPGSAVNEYSLYVNGMPATVTTPTSNSVYACLDTQLVHTFETGDARLANWVRVVQGTAPVMTYYFPYKYASSTAGAQNVLLLRTGEVYLIRAEARAEQNNLSGAASDLNAVRARATLAATTATDQQGLLNAIAHERRVELFTEFGNRFFDLKRTGKIDSVMTAFAPIKGATWSAYMKLYPLPLNDLLQDPNLTQNPGYPSN
ncbi:RagB/SusD family nutrient uptake outer membrane protein [Dinghuibacter silviterrae]|uniref:Putative outer membrane starch-binding protein n=1 Tax=Dinghuibacter silviterrae TaxID=1539049 RepID=A0A4R8DTF4_9BACT|nr:RagB/SusD family nutrient uptake outer membrane protein [Dinghuibacter silviterrae]TDX01564.1 putative outer membrane starch-binding protein [Dinghuibacter silviterrae]